MIERVTGLEMWESSRRGRRALSNSGEQPNVEGQILCMLTVMSRGRNCLQITQGQQENHISSTCQYLVHHFARRSLVIHCSAKHQPAENPLSPPGHQRIKRPLSDFGFDFPAPHPHSVKLQLQPPSAIAGDVPPSFASLRKTLHHFLLSNTFQRVHHNPPAQPRIFRDNHSVVSSAVMNLASPFSNQPLTVRTYHISSSHSTVRYVLKICQSKYSSVCWELSRSSAVIKRFTKVRRRYSRSRTFTPGCEDIPGILV